MNSDKLEKCSRCESDACYSQKINKEITNFMCYGCGFQSNSLMKNEGEFLNEQIETIYCNCQSSSCALIKQRKQFC